MTARDTLLFALVGALILSTGFFQSWNAALLILNMGLISAIMALGVNLQWGLAGLFNVGIMGFVALGGLAAVVTSMPANAEEWSVGGTRVITLGIAEIIIYILKNEDWLARGVKNVVGLPRPTGVPFEIDLQSDPTFVERAANLGLDPTTASTLYVKLGYSVLFTIVLIALLWLAQKALNSPWGRMMRAIRDNETAAEAMGKDVTARHLQVFILGSAICGMAGAMMTTLDGQLTPGTYQPLRYTFLIWVMVIVGGSGNNFGAVLGGFLVWFLWVQVEPMGLALMQVVTSGMADGFWLKQHLIDSAAHMRLLTMGVVLLLVLRFSPKGLIPER